MQYEAATPRSAASYLPARVGASLPDELGRFLDEAELRQGCDAVVKTNLLDDFSVLELQHARSRELHLLAGISRQASDQEVTESGAGMRATPLPTSDDVVAFRDQVGCAPEVEIRERIPKVSHEGLDVIAAAARFVQRIMQQH